MSVTWRQVAAWRTRRHFLDARRPAGEAWEVVSRLCGLHAQLMPSAEATLSARVDGLADDAVDRALWTDRTLVKTWSTRGTLHLLPAAGYPLWQAGFATYRHYLEPVWLRNFHLSAEEPTALVDAVGEALADRVLTRAEPADEVAARTSAHIGEKLRESWGAYLKPASFQGRLLFGPGEGRFVRFTAPRTWLEVDPAAAGAGAVEEIALRFLAQQGPATREDLARWWV
nr:crosslink repair DNA glycosylase YcaQ family protein [Saccharothrix texasensis]